MVVELPIFKGFVVDVKLRQFRKVENNKITFIEFESEEGDLLLSELISSLDQNDELFRHIKDSF